MDYLLVNRCAIVITPQPPFWEWVNQTSGQDDEFIFEESSDSNIYLIPDYEAETDIHLAIQTYIEENYADIFITELEAWNMDPLTYPETTFKRFQEWFTVSSHTMIFDMVTKPLKRQ